MRLTRRRKFECDLSRIRNNKITLSIKFDIVKCLFVFLHVDVLWKNNSSRNASVVRNRFMQNLKFDNTHFFFFQRHFYEFVEFLSVLQFLKFFKIMNECDVRIFRLIVANYDIFSSYINNFVKIRHYLSASLFDFVI